MNKKKVVKSTKELKKQQKWQKIDSGTNFLFSNSLYKQIILAFPPAIVFSV